MPVIPTLTTSPGAVPDTAGGRIPQIDTGAMTAPLRVAAQGDIALSQQAGDFASKYIDAKLQVDAANQTADLSKQLTELQFRASKIPDRQQATAFFDDGAAKIRDAYTQSDANPFVKQHVIGRLSAEVALRRADAQNASYRLESQTQLGQLDTQLNDITKEAATIADPRLREIKLQQGQDAIDGRVAGGWMNPEAGAQRKIMFQSATYKNIIETAMARDPAEGVAAYKQYEGKLSAGDQAELRVRAASAEKGIAVDSAASGLLGGAPGSVSAVVAPIVSQFPELQGRITSGDRDAAHNTAVGGAANSMHLQHDRAIDISLAGMDPAQQQRVLDAVLSNPNVHGFGYYPETQAIHIDTREGARTAWGSSRQSGSVGQNWPGWMTEKVQAWQSGTPPTGDAFADYRTKKLGQIAAYVSDPANGTERFNVAARAQSMLGAQNAYNESQRKQVTDQFDLAITNLAIRQKDYVPGTLSKLADQIEATGDHSMAAIYRDMAQHEDDLKNFWSLPPAQQARFAYTIPGEAGRQVRGVLREETKQRTVAMQAGNEQLRIVQQAIANKDNPTIAQSNAEEAIRQFQLANRPDLARRIAEDFLGHAKGYDLGHVGTPMQLEDRRRAIQEAVDQGGDGLRTMLATQKTFEAVSAKAAEQWKNSPLDAYANMSGVSLGTLPTDPKMLPEFLASRSVIAHAAQTALYDGAPVRPQAQTVSMLTPAEATTFKNGLAAANLPQIQQTVATWAKAAAPYMIAPLVRQIAGDEFGNAVGQAMWLYKRDQPGDRDIADKVLMGMDLRRKGGPEMKDMIKESDGQVRADIDQALGNSRQAMAYQPETLKMLNDATVALYTAMMFGHANKNNYQSDVMKDAIKAIYGERYNSRNGDVLLPTNVGPSDFRRGLFNLTDADVPAFETNKQKLTADMVKQSGQLVTVGDGVYKVQFPDRNGGAMHDIPTATGQPWTIDIRQLIARARGQLQGDLGQPLMVPQ